MNELYYVGLDVHKRTISYCVKQADGRVVKQGSVAATRAALREWAVQLPGQWSGAMEATMFTGWIYDFLRPQAVELQVAHPYMLRAIAAAKKKNDRVDAAKLADALRCDLLPTCWMAPSEMRELRRVLRYRNLLVREAVRMKNKTAGLLMEVGAEFNKGRLHGRRYFHELVEGLEEVPESVKALLELTHSHLEIFERAQKRLLRALREHPLLAKRVDRLRSIPGVGEVTALTWALEIVDPNRFSSGKRAVSYCGLCSAQDESGGKSQRHPLSKQRNAHLQMMLVEAAQLAPRFNPELARVYERERARGAHHNRAVLAVARKLVGYLLAVDKRGTEFQPRPLR